MARYAITTTVADGEGCGGSHYREVEFDGGQITRAWRDGEEIPPDGLAFGFRSAVEAILRAHENSGHHGKNVTLQVRPEAALPPPRWEEGHRVRHIFSGWSGEIADAHDREPDEFQGGQVTVYPRRAHGFGPPITVTHDELEATS